MGAEQDGNPMTVRSISTEEDLDVANNGDGG